MENTIIVTSRDELQKLIIESLTVCLDVHDRHKTHSSNLEEYINITEAAKFLSLSIHTIYGLVNKNLLPYNKKGKRLYFSKQELTNWIKEGRIRTKADLDENFHNNFNKK